VGSRGSSFSATRHTSGEKKKGTRNVKYFGMLILHTRPERHIHVCLGDMLGNTRNLELVLVLDFNTKQAKFKRAMKDG
jgi:hypothetical protein